VHRAGATFRLLPKEAELLAHLLRHRGATCSRDDILRAVWGYDATPTTRTVDTQVFQLRQKLERDPRSPKCCSPCTASATCWSNDTTCRARFRHR
jgi:DNA-binding response OmpR family regulator